MYNVTGLLFIFTLVHIVLRGGEGTTLYKPYRYATSFPGSLSYPSRSVGTVGKNPGNEVYRYVPPKTVGFLGLFGLKRAIHFAHFALELGMVFEGTTGVYERIYRFNSK